MSIPGVVYVHDLIEEIERLYDRPHKRPLVSREAMNAAFAALTWEQLVTEVPALADLLAEAQQPSAVPWDDRWYGQRGQVGFKPRLMRLVGHYRDELDWLLSSARAYDIAYQRLLRAVEESSPDPVDTD